MKYPSDLLKINYKQMKYSEQEYTWPNRQALQKD